MKSVTITTNVVSMNLVHGEVYSIQPYVIKLVSDLRLVGGFLQVQYTPSVSTIKLSGPTYSSQNVRQMSDKFESQHSLSPTIWSDILVGHFGLGRTFWSDVKVDIKRFFFTFLEVNMSNIL
jgi:hypothetical protein